MNIRGLHNFLTEVATSTSEAQAHDRINLELFKIKKAFISPKLSSYDRKKYIAKLCFIILNGIEVNFGLQQVIELIISKKTSFQRIGWMAAAIFCGSNSEHLNSIIPEIKRQLNNKKDEFAVCFTLSAISSIGGAELAESVGPIIAEIAFDQKYSEHARKKALLTLTNLYQSTMQLSSVDRISAKIPSLLKDSNYGIRLCGSHLIYSILQIQPNLLESEIFSLALEVLQSFFTKNDYSAEYTFFNLPFPLLASKLFRILSFQTDWNPADLITLEDIIIKIIEKNSSFLGSEDSLVTFYTIFSEVVEISVSIEISDSITQQIIEILFQNINSNFHFLQVYSLQKLDFLIEINPHYSCLVQPYLSNLYQMIKCGDHELDILSINLLYTCAFKEIGLDIVSEFLSYLPNSSNYLHESLCIKSSYLILSYAFDEIWAIDKLISIIDYCEESYFNEILKIINQFIAQCKVLNYLIFKLTNLILESNQTNFNEFLFRLLSYLYGEYCHQINNNDIQVITTKIKDSFDNFSEQSKGIIITSLFKIALNKPEFQEETISFFQQYLNSDSFDISQRCKEYSILLKYPETFQTKILNSSKLLISNNFEFITQNEIEEEEEDVERDSDIIFYSEQLKITSNVIISSPKAFVTLKFESFDEIEITEIKIDTNENLKYEIVDVELPMKLEEDSTKIIQIEFIALNVFVEYPILHIKCDQNNIIKAKIPISLLKWFQKIDFNKKDFGEKWNKLYEEVVDHLVVPDDEVIPEIIRIVGNLLNVSPSLILKEKNVVAYALKVEFSSDFDVYVLAVFEYIEENMDLVLKLRSNSKLEINEMKKYFKKAFTD